jgi:hypothetical protein
MMRRYLNISALMVLVSGIAFPQSLAGVQNCTINWDAPIMISSPAGDSYSPRIALTGNDTVHITWQWDHNTKLPYRRSVDGGNSFETVKEMILDTVRYPYDAACPIVLASGNNVSLFFIAGRSTGHSEPLSILSSLDGGTTWGDLKDITSDSSGYIAYGTICGDTLLLMYSSAEMPESRIIISTDAGQNWNRIYYDVDYDARFAITSGIIHATSRTGCAGSSAGELLYAKSTNLGQSWCDSTLLSSNDGYFSELSSLEATNYDNISQLWTAWRDDKYGHIGILGSGLLARMNINDRGWQPEELLTDQSEPGGILSSLSMNKKYRAVSWWHEEVAGESIQVVVRATQVPLPSLSPMINITPHQHTGSAPMMKVSSHAIHVVWEQLDTDGRFHIYYRKGEFAESHAMLKVTTRPDMFDITQVGTSRSGVVRVHNTGADNLYIGSAISGRGSFVAVPESLSIAPGDSSLMTVLFEPSSEGFKEANIVIYHNGNTSPDCLSVSGDAISCEYTIGKWNLISSPFRLEAGSLLPVVYSWDSSYVRSDSMSAGKGYWAKPSSRVFYSGSAIMEGDIQVRSGWNLIGSLALPIPSSSLTTVPSDIIASPFFGSFSGRYIAVDTLKPGYGYWVKVKQDGTLVLQGRRNKE